MISAIARSTKRPSLGKATVATLYGVAPRLSYFNGCSGGGRMSFMEAQRFPRRFRRRSSRVRRVTTGPTSPFRRSAWRKRRTSARRVSFLPAKYPALHQAALDTCDALDGWKDGLIADPTTCRSIRPCWNARAAMDRGCLTKAQVVAARRIYAPVLDPKTGAQMSSGLEPGSEMQWGERRRQRTPLDVQRSPQIRGHEGSRIGTSERSTSAGSWSWRERPTAVSCPPHPPS